MNAKEETKLVKNSLKALGLHGVRVGHGRGTAGNWLYVTVDATSIIGDEHDGETRAECSHFCPSCMRYRAIYEALLVEVLRITGRSGDYHGETSITVKGHHGAERQPVEHAPTSRLMALFLDHGFESWRCECGVAGCPECAPEPDPLHISFLDQLGVSL